MYLFSLDILEGGLRMYDSFDSFDLFESGHLGILGHLRHNLGVLHLTYLYIFIYDITLHYIIL